MQKKFASFFYISLTSLSILYIIIMKTSKSSILKFAFLFVNANIVLLFREMRKTTKKNKNERGLKYMENKLFAKYIEDFNSKGKVYSYIQFGIETNEGEEIKLSKAFIDDATKWLIKQYDHIDASYRTGQTKKGKDYEYIGAYLNDNEGEQEIARMFLSGTTYKKVLKRLNINKYAN